jgi:hypothetical protein
MILNKHVATKHEGKSKSQCKDWDKVFTKARELEVHKMDHIDQENEDVNRSELFYCDHLRWSDFLACQEVWISNSIWRKTQIKSGLGPCIAPNAGLALHPVKGKYSAVNAESRL